ncbi:hypothetical protein HDU81_002966 [Chytriomyces hyalinus]|nr:hypothetical protein HDU81_002966 [Chytriomyces hyalinus]
MFKLFIRAIVLISSAALALRQFRPQPAENATYHTITLEPGSAWLQLINVPFDAVAYTFDFQTGPNSTSQQVEIRVFEYGEQLPLMMDGLARPVFVETGISPTEDEGSLTFNLCQHSLHLKTGRNLPIAIKNTDATNMLRLLTTTSQDYGFIFDNVKRFTPLILQVSTVYGIVFGGDLEVAGACLYKTWADDGAGARYEDSSAQPFAKAEDPGPNRL